MSYWARVAPQGRALRVYVGPEQLEPPPEGGIEKVHPTCIFNFYLLMGGGGRKTMLKRHFRESIFLSLLQYVCLYLLLLLDVVVLLK